MTIMTLKTKQNKTKTNKQKSMKNCLLQVELNPSLDTDWTTAIQTTELVTYMLTHNAAM
jgi:hypothetical protein